MHIFYLPPDAMPEWYMLSSCVRLSVRPFVTSGNCTKIAKKKHRITQKTPHNSPPRDWRQRSQRNCDEVPTTGAPNRRGIRSNWRFSTNISLYLTNGERQEHSYYGLLIWTCMCSIKWRHFQCPWVTSNYPKPLKPAHFRYSVICIAFRVFIVGGDRVQIS